MRKSKKKEEKQTNRNMSAPVVSEGAAPTVAMASSSVSTSHTPSQPITRNESVSPKSTAQ